MKNYICFIMTHGDLAFELNRVAQKFLPLDMAVHLYSNKKDSMEAIIDDAGNRIKEAAPQGIIIFVDLVGGSCWRAAAELKRNFDNVTILGGVNLPALVSLAANVNRLDWPQLVSKIEQDAVKGIKVI